MPNAVPVFAAGFAPCPEELELAALPVSGTLPPWLRGALYRNGPALWQAGVTPLAHWFDGFAKLHRFGFAGDGTVSYRSRMLGSEQYQRSQKRGRLWWRLFATEQKRRWYHKLHFLLRPFYGDNALVNIVPLAGGMAALTEAPRSVGVDPQTLAVLGDVRFGDRIVGHNTTAHPLVDPDTGEVINLLTKYGKVTKHQFVRLPRGSRTRELIGAIDAMGEPSYHHSFGLTKRFIVFTEWPFVVNPLRILFGDTTILGSYRWKPELGLRIRLLERATGKVFGPFRTEACFGFHHVNAWDHEGGVTSDIAILEDHRIFDELLMERVRRQGFTIGPRLMRFRIDLAAGTVQRAAVGTGTFDFPIIDEHQRCRPTTVVWGCGETEGDRDGMLNQIIRREIAEGSPVGERRWYQRDCYPGEPVFVPRPGGASHDGVLLSVVFDGTVSRSFVAVLDATTLAEIARIDVPQVVPFGFHGSFVQG
jgi:carotenoid cleavage dioxygenase-like enzyme